MGYIGAQIKSKMEALDISAHGLEKKAGLRPSAVQNILYGRSKNPSIFIVQAIAQALDCSVADLIGEQESINLDYNPKASLNQLNKDDAAWDCALYLDSLETVARLLKRKKHYHLKSMTILDYADEVYTYSLKRGIHSVDVYFTEWLIEKSSISE